MECFKKTEIGLYTIIWTSAVLFSIISFSRQSSKYFSEYKDDYNDFEQGYFIEKWKDVADLEWQTMLYLFKRIWVWIVVLLFVSQFLRSRRYVESLKLFQVFISVLFICIHLGPIAFIGILTQPLVFKIVHTLSNKRSVMWVANIVMISIISLYKYKISSESFMATFKFNEKENYLHVLAIYWTNLRSFSYFMEKDGKSEENYLDLFSYCLYLPVLFNGPFIFYEDFQKGYSESSCMMRNLIQILGDFTRFMFWLVFIEISLHYIYVNATSFQIQLVESFDGWALYGYGYLMGQYFHMKYLVVYGLSTSIAKFENIPVPHLPKCIGRIHLYSDMWKYFDNGLYKFLLRYIYVPVMKSSYLNNKVLASLFCFTFVYIWHGLDSYILIWVLLNFFGIAVENISAYFYKAYLEDLKVVEYMGKDAVRRITCFLASFLLAMSAISNFFFFAGLDIGTIFVMRVLEDDLRSNVILIVALYCCCQLSTELRTKSDKKHRD